MGTRLGDKHPTRFRRVQGELNFEEIPSSVQDSEILGSWMRIKHKWKAMGSASYPEAGKGQRECILPMFPCGSSLVARLYLAKNEAPEEEAAMGRWKNTWKFFINANFNRIKPIITLENKHVVISWSSASASVSDNLAPVVRKLDSALAPVRHLRWRIRGERVDHVTQSLAARNNEA